jgi:hypothetical protein
MALHFETKIYAAVVDLGKTVIPAVRNMQRDVKQLLGRLIVDEVLWMGVLIMRINKAPGANRPPMIEELIEHLELVQMALRFCRELKYISPADWAKSLPLIESVGKQAYGWRDSFAPA